MDSKRIVKGGPFQWDLLERAKGVRLGRRAWSVGEAGSSAYAGLDAIITFKFF
jgi:hypothetical protein